MFIENIILQILRIISAFSLIFTRCYTYIIIYFRGEVSYGSITTT